MISESCEVDKLSENVIKEKYSDEPIDLILLVSNRN